MIFGNCPYQDCDETFNVPMQNGVPIQKQVCEKCGKTFWTLHSRIDPKSWTDEGFKEVASVNEETKHITFKEGFSLYD